MVKNIPYTFGCTVGCDPEVFLSREVGKVRKRQAIVGSEVVIPERGLGSHNSVVRDGVQVELHPQAIGCRANLSLYIQDCFRRLDQAVREARKKPGMENLKVDFRQVVKLSKGDLARLHPDSRVLGCTPSLNIYGRKHINKDGERFLTRSAAGHVHIGMPAIVDRKVDPIRAVRIMDVLVGNTSVLLDRNPLAAERRKTYGRAGEYRLPKHGLEYRTLSNFWLRHYQVMSFVFGMTKMAMMVAQSEAAIKQFTSAPRTYGKQNRWEAERELMQNVDLRLIERAINTNDFDLARSNYEKWVKPFLKQISVGQGVGAYEVDYFDFFVDQIRANELAGGDGLSAWFTEDPLQHWLTKPDGHGNGFETLMAGTVQRARMAAERAKAKISGVILTPPPTGAPTFGEAPAVVPADIPTTVVQI